MGARGFGRATAERFAAEGARIVVADLDEAGGTETCRRVAAAGSDAELVVGYVSTLLHLKRRLLRPPGHETHFVTVDGEAAVVRRGEVSREHERPFIQ